MLQLFIIFLSDSFLIIVASQWSIIDIIVVPPLQFVSGFI